MYFANSLVVIGRIFVLFCENLDSLINLDVFKFSMIVYNFGMNWLFVCEWQFSSALAMCNCVLIWLGLVVDGNWKGLIHSVMSRSWLIHSASRIELTLRHEKLQCSRPNHIRHIYRDRKAQAFIWIYIPVQGVSVHFLIKSKRIWTDLKWFTLGIQCFWDAGQAYRSENWMSNPIDLQKQMIVVKKTKRARQLLMGR